MRRAAIAIASIVVALAGLTAITVVGTAGAAAPTLTDSLVASVAAPTVIVFTPDGMLVTTQPGKLFVVRGGAAKQLLDLGPDICANSERGLLGVAVDPSFTTSRFIYLYYTQKANTPAADKCPAGSHRAIPTPTNHVARFKLNADDTLSDELTVLDQFPNYNGNHNGGDLVFGPDGKLYVSVGDGGCDLRGDGCAGANDVSRDVDIGIGKILRVNPDGTIPSDNPYADEPNPCGDDGETATDHHCPETWAQGFRNPFRMAFGPGGKLYVNDVGQGVWEEIDDVTTGGGDYGWNVREGHCANNSTTDCGAPPAGMTNPILDYPHSGTPTCTAITGGAFVPSAAPWPTDYQGSYLFADYGCGKIFRLKESAGTFTREDLVTNLGANSAVHLEFGPDNALYYSTYAGGGSIRKLTVGTPPPPSSSTPPSSTPTSCTPLPSGTVALSSFNASPAKNGLGPYQKDHNNAGGPIVLGSTTYCSGLGVYPYSALTYNLAKQYKTFNAVFGVDESCGNTGAVRFEAHKITNGTDKIVALSGTLTGVSNPLPITADITGADTLRLQVIDVGSNGACARADWADARLLTTGTPPSSTTPPSTTPPSTTPPSTTPPSTTPTSCTPPPTGGTLLSSLNPSPTKNGLGPYQRDHNNAGGPIALGSTTYCRGLGVYPYSALNYNLAKQYTTFKAVFGVDESCGNAGKVRFEVHRTTNGTDKIVASKTALTGASVPLSVTADVTGADALRIQVIDDGSNGTCARSDWADARVIK